MSIGIIYIIQAPGIQYSYSCNPFNQSNAGHQVMLRSSEHFAKDRSLQKCTVSVDGPSGFVGCHPFLSQWWPKSSPGRRSVQLKPVLCRKPLRLKRVFSGKIRHGRRHGRFLLMHLPLEQRLAKSEGLRNHKVWSWIQADLVLSKLLHAASKLFSAPTKALQHL